MKRITLALCLSVLMSAPVYAETLCQEEANAEGYNAPVDTLKPCTPQKDAGKEGYSDQIAKAREQQDTSLGQDAGALEQLGQAQIQ